MDDAALDINIAELHELLGPESWRLTPATFAAKVSEGRWKAARHLLYISMIVAQALARGNARIVVSMPPRHGKSQFLSRYTTEWLFDLRPDIKVMLTSYGADLATGFGRLVRDDLIDYYARGITTTKLRDDSQTVGHFITTAGGEMYAVGVGGAITGRGADVLLIDDYLKNAKDAASEGIRNDIWDWFTSTAFTRLEPGGSIIILATRWNRDDLIGRIKSSGGEYGDWIFVELPALSLGPDKDRLGREVEEPLWPERYPKFMLEQIRTILGTYFWQALYQQAPIPRIAGVITRSMIPQVDIIPHRSKLRLCRSWDFAGSEGEGDWTVGHLQATDDKNFTFFIDQVRGQWSPSKTEEIVKATAEKDGRDVSIELEQEPGSAGKTVAEHYMRTVLKGFIAKANRPTGPKTVRASPLLAGIEAGHTRILQGPWNNAFYEELEMFPDGPNDDQVDAAAAAYNKLNGRNLRAGTFGRGLDQVGQNQLAGTSSPPMGAEVQRASQLVTGITFGRR